MSYLETPKMKRLLALAPALTLTAGPALAHLDPTEHGSFVAGVSHPVFGADHILAMVAVGLWAVTLAGRSNDRRALAALPVAFVSAMAAGFLLAMAGVGLPFVEPMILASVLVLGGLCALALRLPLMTAAGLTALFGLFHGHAHGAELGSAEALPYLAGFALATALLHAAGVLGGLGIAQRAPFVTRALGGLVALAGSALIIAG